MAFLLDNLAAHAPRQTVSAGVRLSANGLVQVASHTPGLLTATVQDDGKAYDVVIKYRKEPGDIEAASCTCPQFTQDESIVYCRHIVAAALRGGRIFPNISRGGTENTGEGLTDEGGMALRKVPDVSGAAGAEKTGVKKAETDGAKRERLDRLLSDEMCVRRPNNATPSFVSEAAEPRRPLPVPRERQTDYIAAQLLRNTAARDSKFADVFVKEEPFRLEAMIGADARGPVTLSFRIGREHGGHLYIIRDLWEFVDGFRTGALYALGTKGGNVCLCREAFAPDSLPLLEFLLNRYDPMSSGYQGRAKDRRDMALNPAEADAFFAAAGSVRMKTQTWGEERTLPIKDGDYSILIRVEKAAASSGGGLVLRTSDHYRIVSGSLRIYAISEDAVWRSSEECAAACRGLLSALAAGRGALYFAEKDIPTMFANVIRRVEPYLTVEMSDEVERIVPPELKTRVWFDMSEAGYVTARMDFSYGDLTHNAFEEPKRPEVSLDPAGEAYAESVLRHYVGQVSFGAGMLVVLDNELREERLYVLATEGLDKIREFAEVFASGSFDTLKAKPPINVSVGVRVDGRLLTLHIGADGVDFSELAGVLRSYRLAKKYHRLKDGSFLALEGDALEELSDLTEGLDLDPGMFKADAESPGQSSVTLDMNRAMYIDAMMRKSDSIRYDRDKNFRSVLHNFSDVANADYQPPAALAGTLRNYQDTGYRWLRTVDALGFGGILADDMGLGKTLQVLSLLSAVKAEESMGGRLPSIVVCPSSIALNWESEAKRFTPDLSVTVVIGSASARKIIIEKAKRHTRSGRDSKDSEDSQSGKKSAKTPDLFVTSYDLLKRDIELYEGIAFRFVIIDEAQYIKNQTTQNAKSVKLLSGRTRLALTGTPIENTLAELWSIFDFLMPGYLFRYNRFKTRFETPIVKQTDTRAEGRLTEMVRPFILRRLKKDVLKELPEKIETVLRSELEGEQRKLYLATMARTKKEFADKLTAAGAPRSKIEILAALTRMRRICCDPAIVFENYSGGSAKLDACMELVESCLESGHRILLFSQFTTMLDRIEKRLWDAKIDWYRLDGSTPVPERHSLMNNFNNGDTPVFLISLRAGGTGLNLTGADIVIHYDPWWNISVQNQATDRAHRIGQTNRVQVFKLIAKDTIEERIMELQDRKADLADRIIREGGDVFETLTEEELLSLFE
ncbi:MAG: DEAD/DEAH box helicase [Clostridiales bacterium]|nr:DEAD/DEAH box helicase [Clostridiales bacterium]